MHNNTVAQCMEWQATAPSDTPSDEKDEAELKLKRLTSFFDSGKQILGYPGIGSGFTRRRNRHRMD